MINKFKIAQTTKDSKIILDSTSLQSIIPADIKLNDVLNKQIDTMLGSPQPQSQPQSQYLSQYSYPYRRG